MKKFLIFVWELTKIVAISLAIILPVRYFLIQPFYVKGASMEPNFHDREYLIIDEISYRFNNPERGQVIVFRYPRNPQEYYIKRVVGLPGEQVLIKDGTVSIFNDEHPDGFMLDEEYLPADLTTANNTEEKILIGENEYYVLGDNRNASSDSRSFGPIDRSYITGKVLFRGWPISEVTVFDNNYWSQFQQN